MTRTKNGLKVFAVLIVLVMLIPFFFILKADATSTEMEKAISWAINTANDQSHGYSQANRNGPDYDCSSFVYYALKSAGLCSSLTYAFNTESMKSQLPKCGFTYISWSDLGGSSNLQRGDILWYRYGTHGHTEIYIGDNKLVGAHGQNATSAHPNRSPSTGDQGDEVSVISFYNSSSNPWMGIFRREGVPPLPDPTEEYFPKCSLEYSSLVEALNSIGVDSSKANRKRIAEANGISNYSYSAEQNTYMLNLLKGGMLINPDVSPTPPVEPEKKWYENVSPVDVGSDFYAYIINVDPWKHLTNNNGNVEISVETAATSQIWRFSRNSDGSYKIVNCADGNCLDVYGAYSDSGTNVQTYPAHDDTPAQKWFIYGSSGEYILRAGCTDCVLDVNGGLRDDGTNVQMWTKNDSSAQTFQIWKLMPELSVETGNKAKLTNFTWTNFPGSDRAYDLKIWKGTLWEGDAYQIDWSLKDNDQKIDLPAGHYEAYIDTRVGTEQLMSNVVKFDITEDYFGQSELKVIAGDKYTKTHFEWTPVEKAEFYDLKIWNGTVWEGDAYQIEWNIKDTSIALALPAGYYEAYIDARDANHMQMSNVVKFAVKRDYQVIEGDANDDGKVTVADAVMLQKWLLGSGELTCWQNVDLCKDNRIDVFDLCLMKRMLIENSGVFF